MKAFKLNPIKLRARKKEKVAPIGPSRAFKIPREVLKTKIIK